MHANALPRPSSSCATFVRRNSRAYLIPLLAGRYDPTCRLCTGQFSGDEPTIRLGCLHVFHLRCLLDYAASLPATTAPAGYVLSDALQCPMLQCTHTLHRYRVAILCVGHVMPQEEHDTATTTNGRRMLSDAHALSLSHTHTLTLGLLRTYTTSPSLSTLVCEHSNARTLSCYAGTRAPSARFPLSLPPTQPTPSPTSAASSSPTSRGHASARDRWL